MLSALLNELNALAKLCRYRSRHGHGECGASFWQRPLSRVASSSLLLRKFLLTKLISKLVLASIAFSASLAMADLAVQGTAEPVLEPTAATSTSVSPHSSEISVSQAPAQDVQRPVGVSASNWLYSLMTLGLIIALILVLAWLAKRAGGIKTMGGRDIRVLSAMPVGSRERIALIEVKGKQIVVGLTTNSVNHLHTFSDEELDAYEETSRTQTENKSDFAQKFQSILSRSQGAGDD